MGVNGEVERVEVEAGGKEELSSEARARSQKFGFGSCEAPVPGVTRGRGALSGNRSFPPTSRAMASTTSTTLRSLWATAARSTARRATPRAARALQTHAQPFTAEQPLETVDDWTAFQQNRMEYKALGMCATSGNVWR
jgi:hypothetical protein